MSKQYRSVFADENVLKKYNCIKSQSEVVSSESPDSLSVNGWSFTTFHSVIPNETETHALVHRLKSRLYSSFESIRNEFGNDESDWRESDSLTFNGFKLKLIPMIFTNDILRISRKSTEDRQSSAALHLRSEDALYCWIIQHTAEHEVNRAVEVLQVPYAKNWHERHIQNTSSGLITQHDLREEPLSVAPAMSATAAAATPSDAVRRVGRPCDWTLTSDYCCSLASGGAAAVLAGRLLPDCLFSSSDHNNNNNNNNSSSSCPNECVPTLTREEVSGIDLDLLRDRTAPILFYDECILYQDDLDDSGEVLFDVKLRVMPTCWFLVSKFYLRVDGVVSRCRETRLFHNFSWDSSKVQMELTWRELSHVSTASTAATAAPVSAVPVRSVFSSSNSVEARNSTHLLPVVNESQGVHRFYSFCM